MSTTTEPVADHAGTLERLYRAEYIGMVRLAYTLVGSNAEAEDLVQDSFVEVSRRLSEIRKPGAYLRSAAVSRCRSALRRRRVMAMHPPEPPAGLASDAGELWDVLGKLPDAAMFASHPEGIGIIGPLLTEESVELHRQYTEEFILEHGDGS